VSVLIGGRRFTAVSLKATFILVPNGRGHKILRFDLYGLT